MKTQMKKKFGILALACCLSLGSASHATAATDTKSTVLAGVTVIASLSMDTAIGTQSASGYTALGSAAGYLSVSVSYSYQWGISYPTVYGSNYTSYGTSVSAYAYAPEAPAVPISASGSHYVNFNQITWTPSTYVKK